MSPIITLIMNNNVFVLFQINSQLQFIWGEGCKGTPPKSFETLYKTDRAKGATTCSAVSFVLFRVTEENNALHSDFSPGERDVTKDRLDCHFLCLLCFCKHSALAHSCDPDLCHDLLYTSGLAPLRWTAIIIRLGHVMSGLFSQNDRESHTNGRKKYIQYT